MKSNKALILVNIGTPNSFAVADVQKYLSEFLSDKDVLSIPWFIRLPLVKWFIAPRRAPVSALKYEKIWTSEGSPLLIHANNLARNLREILPQYQVEIAMRYGTPSIESVLTNLNHQDVEEILVVPMYPQYAEATTGSSLKEIFRIQKKLKANFQIKTLPPYFHRPEFIRNLIQQAADLKINPDDFDRVLLSYHGLPESQLRRDPGCQLGSCCEQAQACQRNCYRAHCLATSKALIQELKISPKKVVTTFQSRLGPIEWIKPYTDESIKQMAQAGTKSILVFCPSFVADCLETLEEVAMENAQLFKKNGGERFVVVPCLNSSSQWARGLAQIILDFDK